MTIVDSRPPFDERRLTEKPCHGCGVLVLGGNTRKWCPDCKRLRKREQEAVWRAKTPYNRSQRYRQVKHRYGVDRVAYEAMLAVQCGLCAACGRPEPRPRATLSVDHDHVTGAVRGLLCDHCNNVLGRVDDDPTRLLALVKYLWVSGNKRPSWDRFFLDLAFMVSLRADCRRRRHGAVIVRDSRIVSAGYNGAPAGDPGCLAGACPRGLLSYEEVASMSSYDSGPGRCISIHAEQNALLYSSRTDVEGAQIYVTGRPCPTCQRLILGSGIIRVVFPEDGKVMCWWKEPGEFRSNWIEVEVDPR